MSKTDDKQTASETETAPPHEASFDDFRDSSFYRAEDAARLYVYRYHHLDDLSFVRIPEEVFSNLKPGDFNRLLDAVRQRFLAAGWEGDGKLGIIWLPPFVDTGFDDTWGNYLWHVKQENNGTSWVASKSPLDFNRIKDQNEKVPSDTHILASVVFYAGRDLITNVRKIIASVVRRIEALKDLSNPLATEIREELLISAQGELVTELHTFLDSCYLQVLLHVLDEGNPSKLHVGKSKVNLNPSDYIPSGPAYPTDRDRETEGKWFTLKGLVRDTWASFKFESFSSKAEMLFGSCEYEIEAGVRQELTKHVQLRNCVQHHSRRVTADSVKHAGVKAFSVLTDNKETMKLASGVPITIPFAELKVFAESLMLFAGDFDKHMGKRVPPLWIPAEQAGKTPKPKTS